MGYEISESVVVVRLRGTRYDGVQAEATSLSVDEWLNLRKPAPDGDPFDARVVDAFAQHLISWNVEYRGEPVPANPESFGKLPDTTLGVSLALGWYQAMATPEFDSPFGQRTPEPEMNGTDTTVMEAL